MTDIRIVQRGSPFEAVTLDWLLTSAGEFDTTQELATAVIVALLTDRRALPEDSLPNPDSEDRRGWWGDTEAEAIWNGWPIGARLWLLSREAITGQKANRGSTLAKIEGYIHEAIEPFVEHKIASAFDVDVTRVEINGVDAVVTLYRGNASDIELRFQNLWSATQAAAVTVRAPGFNDGFASTFV